MVKWTADRWHATYEAGGRTFRLQVEPSPVPGSTGFYWLVFDEEEEIVRSGFRDTAGEAKASCSRAAKAYRRDPRRRWE